MKRIILINFYFIFLAGFINGLITTLDNENYFLFILFSCAFIEELFRMFSILIGCYIWFYTLALSVIEFFLYVFAFYDGEFSYIIMRLFGILIHFSLFFTQYKFYIIYQKTKKFKYMYYALFFSTILHSIYNIFFSNFIYYIIKLIF